MPNNNDRNQIKNRTQNVKQEENLEGVEFGTEIDVNQIKEKNKNDRTTRSNNEDYPRKNPC